MRYRKKPVIVEAQRWWHPARPEHVPIACVEPSGIHEWIIKTLEGPMIVRDGDWIITGVAGENYPCRPDIFETTYERVREE